MLSFSSSEQSPLLIKSSKDQGRGLGSVKNKPNKKDFQEPTKEKAVVRDKSTTHNKSADNATIYTLAFVVFVQAYLLEGVFPYAGFLTMHLLSCKNNGYENDSSCSTKHAIDEENVGKYAGFVACCFMVGRTVTAVAWGKIADTYGRVFVLKVSLVASAITSIGFGFAKTYWEALLWRFLMGFANGITGTIKCLLSEIRASSGSQTKETKTMAIVYGMRGYGFLICPGITGYLSDPIKQYPSTMASVMRPIKSLLRAYPFVLPNILACGLCILACLLVKNHVDETLPNEKCEPFPSFFTAAQGILCRYLPGCNDNTTGSHTDSVQRELHGTILPDTDKMSGGNIIETGVQEMNSEPSITTKDLLWNNSKHGSAKRKIRCRWYHLYAYWMYSFLNIATDELFPLFCLSKLSGLGLKEKEISFLLAGSTVFYGLLQYLLLTGLVRNLGLYPTLRVGIFWSIPLGFLIPLASLRLIKKDNVTGSGYKGDQDPAQSIALGPLLILYLCFLIAVIKSFSSVVFSALNMAINRTVDTIDQRATLNGIASLGGSLAKACGPLFAGFLFSFLAGDTKDLTFATSTENYTMNGYGNGNTIPKNDDSDGTLFHHFAICPPYGSVVAYGFVSILGLVLGLQSLKLREMPTGT